MSIRNLRSEVTRQRNLTSNPMWNSVARQKVSIKLRTKNLSEQLLRNLYCNKQLSTAKIAYLTGTSKSTVVRHLHYHNILIRSNYANWAISPSEDLAYILGVLKGDGYVTINLTSSTYTIGLAVTNKKFAQSFLLTLKRIGLNPRMDERDKHWIFKEIDSVRKGFSHFYCIRAFSKYFVTWYKQLDFNDISAILREQKYYRAFIRGFYESEGNLQVRRTNPNYRMVRMYNKNKFLLKFIQKLLSIDKLIFALKKQRANMYYLYAGRKKTVNTFLKLINPCIKSGIC